MNDESQADLRALGERLRKLREARSMSQSQFARAVGISQASISRVERGERPLQTQAAVVVAKRFDIPVSWLLTGQPESTPLGIETQDRLVQAG